MTHIHPNIPQHGRFDGSPQDLRTTLFARLKGAHVRGQHGGAAAYRAAQRGDVGEVTEQIKSLAANASAQESRYAKETTARIREAVGDIAVATEAGQPGRAGAFREGNAISYDRTWVNPKLVGASLESASFPAGEERRVEFEVTQQGEPAGLFMQFDGAALDLGAAIETLKMEVAGPLGARELSFASGTTVHTIMATINSNTSSTGVDAVMSGVDSFRLHSSEVGTDEFVSVRIIDDGGMVQPKGTGIYELDPDNFTQVDGPPTRFGDAGNLITDLHGKDLHVSFEGNEIIGGSRESLQFVSDDYVMNMKLGDLGKGLGVKHALTFRGIARGAISGSLYPSLPGVNYAPSFVSPTVDNVAVDGATFAAGETRDISFDLLASAHPAGYFMDFGGAALDLGAATETFKVDIGGKLGSRELSFASGTTLNTIAAAIDSFAEVTGVHAFVSGGGIVVRTHGFGSTEFVSLTVIDDGHIEQGPGLIRLDGDNFHAATGTTTVWSSIFLANGVTDAGRDVKINWRDQVFTGTGFNVRFLGPDYTVSLALDPEQQRYGALHAATISAAAKVRDGIRG